MYLSRALLLLTSVVAASPGFASDSLVSVGKLIFLILHCRNRRDNPAVAVINPTQVGAGRRVQSMRPVQYTRARFMGASVTANRPVQLTLLPAQYCIWTRTSTILSGATSGMVAPPAGCSETRQQIKHKGRFLIQ